MKKNVKIVQINGFRGLLLTIFIVSCLIAGFVVFPAFLTMNVWNYLAIKTGSFPVITVLGGILLWAIIAFSLYLFNNRRFIVAVNTQQELTEAEVKDVMNKIKSQQLNSSIMLTKDVNINPDKNEQLSEATKEHNNN